MEIKFEPKKFIKNNFYLVNEPYLKRKKNIFKVVDIDKNKVYITRIIGSNVGIYTPLYITNDCYYAHHSINLGYNKIWSILYG